MDLVHQLHSAVEEVQWQHRRLTIAGLSLGGGYLGQNAFSDNFNFQGAVALLFYNEYPHMVERLVLAGSGGSPIDLAMHPPTVFLHVPM